MDTCIGLLWIVERKLFIARMEGRYTLNPTPHFPLLFSRGSFCMSLYLISTTVVFGQGTKLIVTDQTLPAPSLTLHRPSTQELDKGEATLVCLASKMSVGYADVSWTANGSPVTTGVVTSPASVQDDGTFSLSSFLSVSAADWDSDRSYSCTVSQGGSASASRQVKKSQCLL